MLTLIDAFDADADSDDADAANTDADVHMGHVWFNSMTSILIDLHFSQGDVLGGIPSYLKANNKSWDYDKLYMFLYYWNDILYICLPMFYYF